MARVLVVDDEIDFRRSVADALRDAGHDVYEGGDAEEAIARLANETFDILLTDLRMPGAGGIALLREASLRTPDCILIVMTAYGSLETAIEARRIGAHDYLLKPVELEGLVRKVNLLSRHQTALAENRFLRAALQIDAATDSLVGVGPALRDVRRLIAKVAPTDSTVLIRGETGTGKELVARAVHQSSPRREQPFVTINCGSIPDTLLESELFGHVRGAFTGAERDKRGLFEVAGGGSIFLDEIGELPLAVQPKILRALEMREIQRIGSTAPIRISARIIAATHRDLQAMVRDQKFREDLFYRLNVFEILLPPLRDRIDDLQPLALHLLTRFCRAANRPLPVLAPEALRAMAVYRWPGNIRELANVLERAVILAESERITLAELPGMVAETGSSGAADDLKAARRAFELAHIHRVLEKFAGDKRRAAEALGLDLSSLYRKLESDEPGR
ncbi:MAG: sigma-54-dependent Fis family transcriptional regulator [Deltaproteobacteria bacterium]|nr:sigma-54-dependent Fis family transcriptional regulator [Deltaproteobacteria bacterium]